MEEESTKNEEVLTLQLVEEEELTLNEEVVQLVEEELTLNEEVVQLVEEELTLNEEVLVVQLVDDDDVDVFAKEALILKLADEGEESVDFPKEIPKVPPMLRRGTLHKTIALPLKPKPVEEKVVFDVGISNAWAGKIKDAKIHLKLKQQQDSVSSLSKARLGVVEVYLCAFSWDSLKDKWHPRGVWKPNEESYNILLNGEKMCNNDLNSIKPRVSKFMQLAKLLRHVEVTKPIENYQFAQYIEIHAHMCLCILLRGIVFMSWSPIESMRCIIRLVQMIVSSDGWYDSDMHVMIFGVIHLYCLKFSLFTCKTIIGIIPDMVNAVNKLEHIASKNNEASHYAKLALLRHYLTQADMVFRSDRSVYLKKASELVSSTILLHPDWVLFQWAETHVLKHFGRLKDASLKLQDIYKIHKSPILEWELASIAFVSKNWVVCKEYLDISQENKKEEVSLLYSACIAKQGFDKKIGLDPTTESVKTLQNATATGSRVWKEKFSMLQYRLCKDTLYYEMCYFMGYLKWFEIEVTTGMRMGGGLICKKWLEDISVELANMDHGVSVVYHDPLSTHDEAREEYLAVCHLRGAVASSHGKFELAARCFKHVLDNPYKDLSDPWHQSFAHLELGFMYIRKGMYTDAKNEFIAVLKNKQQFVFKKLAIQQSNLALTYLRDMKLVKMNDVKEKDDNALCLYYLQLDVPNAGEFTSIVIDAGETRNHRMNMKKDTTVHWVWGVMFGSIQFDISFGENIEIIEEYKAEVGDINKGFFTSKEDGFLVLKWDNTQNSTERSIHYIVY